jgi:hypothetical protein
MALWCANQRHIIGSLEERQKYSTEMETVGGPIDVAVISKGDGFIWIKRKHYFDKEHNPQFFARFDQGLPKQQGLEG